MVQIVGRYLALFGLILIVVGGVFLLAGKLPWIGKLPGDILIKKENFTFYFPITTCILASMILSLIFFLIFRR